MLGADVKPVIIPKKSGYRFRDDTWTDNQVFDFVKQSYLLTSRWLQSSINAVEGMDKSAADNAMVPARKTGDGKLKTICDAPST